MNYISLFVGKAVILLMRLMGRNANTLPGLIIERINKKYLKDSLSKLEKGVIVVTGTNGKTTTTKILSTLLEGLGYRVLTNQTGGNYVRGVISLVLDKSSWTNKLNYDIAILELDEAHGVHFVNYFNPTGVVTLNILRDQMDRFGEIDKTAELVKKIAKKARSFVIINSNDPRLSKMSNHLSSRIYWYGYAEELKDVFKSDDQHYDKNVKYFVEHKLDLSLVSYSKNTLNVKAEKTYQLPFNLSGSYNALNIVAALTALKAIEGKLDFAEIEKILSEIKPAFGRGEIIKLANGAKIQLQLVKNPSGFNQSLSLVNENNFDKIGIVINDRYADGRDVSWLYDTDFKNLKDNQVFTSGIRYLDMAVRLKHQEIKSKNIEELRNFVEELIDLKENQSAIIYCTYTAMLEVRRLLRKTGVSVEGVGL
jgi:UDP-N-acetylmuramyl tripeptide synthase